MNIQNIPVTPVVDKNGNITIDWRNSLQQTITQLQTFLSNEKYLLPQQPDPRGTSTNIAGLNIQQNLGGIHYNTQTNSPMINLTTYSATDPTSYQFVPQTTFHSVSTTDDLNAIPTTQRNGKFVTVAADPSNLYVGVGTVWKQVAIT